MLENISVIIPVQPNDTAHEALVEDLKKTQAQIIISSRETRAESLNAGASRAKNEFLWFLYPECRVGIENFKALEDAQKSDLKALYYFNLSIKPKCFLSSLAAYGVNSRAKFLGLPNGAQGFCISKEMFQKTGGFPVTKRLIEDLLFVLNAQKSGVTLNQIKSVILYEDKENQSIKEMIERQKLWVRTLRRSRQKKRRL